MARRPPSGGVSFGRRLDTQRVIRTKLLLNLGEMDRRDGFGRQRSFEPSELRTASSPDGHVKGDFHARGRLTTIPAAQHPNIPPFSPILSMSCKTLPRILPLSPIFCRGDLTQADFRRSP